MRLSQPATGYRAAIDPVLLAAAIDARPTERLLDLGCGVGAASLCLLARLPGVQVTGWEIDSGLAQLARRNAETNEMGERFHVVERDALGSAPEERFDQVFSNPPFHGAAETDAAPDAVKARATVEFDLDGWIAAAAGALKHKGRLTLIFRADRLDALLAALGGQFGGIVVFPLWPRAGQPAKRILVRAAKGSRAALTLAQGLILHDEGGYSAMAEQVLRDGVRIPF